MLSDVEVFCLFLIIFLLLLLSVSVSSASVDDGAGSPNLVWRSVGCGDEKQLQSLYNSRQWPTSELRIDRGCGWMDWGGVFP